MRIFSIIFLVAAMFLVPLCLEAVPPDPALLKIAQPIIDQALEAYNAQDPVAFYKDWAESMKGVATPQVFAVMFTNMYFKHYGKYVSKEMLVAECVLMEASPVGILAYKAEFEKNKSIKIAVNVTNENGVWKLMQIQFNPM